MKIGIIGANGKAGKAIAKEAAERGHEVTAIVRDTSKIEGSKFKILQKDIMALQTKDLENFDAVADAFGTWLPETLSMHQTTLAHLADILKGKKTRLLVVGGAGSLYTDKDLKTKLSELPDFPEAIKPLAESMGKALEALRKRDDVMWTYISPAADFQPDGIKTGKYKDIGEEFTLNSEGKSEISYADYASAFLDEIEKPKHIKERFGVIMS